MFVYELFTGGEGRRGRKGMLSCPQFSQTTGTQLWRWIVSSSIVNTSVFKKKKSYKSIIILSEPFSLRLDPKMRETAVFPSSCTLS